MVRRRPGPSQIARTRIGLAADFCRPGLLTARTVPSRSHTEAGTLRKRAQRACRECHAHKCKCSGDLPRCKRCAALGLVCAYMPPKRKLVSAAPRAASKGNSPAVTDESASSPGSASVTTAAHPHLPAADAIAAE